MEELTMTNTKLEEDLKATQHSHLMDGQQGLETLKLRNKFLQERIEQQEKKISTLELTKKLTSKSEGTASVTAAAGQLAKKVEELHEKEKEFGRQRQKLEEMNTKLKYDLER